MNNGIDLVGMVQNIRNNPGELAQILYDNRKISMEQYNDIRQMNGSFSQIGQYLMSNGIMKQTLVDSLSNNIPPMLRQFL